MENDAMTKLCLLAAAAGLSLLLPLASTPAAAAATASATPAPAAKPAAPKAASSKTARRRSTAGQAVTVAPVVQPEALQALQRMSAYLGTLTTFEVKTTTTLDLVTNDDQRLQLDGGADYKVKRPDSFLIEVHSNDKKRTFFYNGKQFTMYAPALGYYATTPAPATIAQTLDLLQTKFGIALPLEDLFRWSDPSLHRADTVKSAFKVGGAVIDGVPTDQYAFREGDIDWQIWIQHDGNPLPRKLVIIDRTDPALPAYSAVLTWDVSPTFAADDFTFRPGPDAKPIRLTAAGQ
jgi:hypothetical protein